jgi:hypothetical protein
LAFSNSLPRVVKLSLSEAAAKTVTVPESFGEEEAEVSDFGEESESESEDEQALRASSAAAPTPATRRVRVRVRRADRVITGLLPRKPQAC